MSYKFLLRLSEEERKKLLKIQKQLSEQLTIQISINNTIQILINEKEINDNDKKE